jgi:hypothetical protein
LFGGILNPNQCYAENIELYNDVHLFNRVSNIARTGDNGFSVGVLLFVRDNKRNANVDINRGWIHYIVSLYPIDLEAEVSTFPSFRYNRRIIIIIAIMNLRFTTIYDLLI